MKRADVEQRMADALGEEYRITRTRRNDGETVMHICHEPPVKRGGLTLTAGCAIRDEDFDQSSHPDVVIGVYADNIKATLSDELKAAA